MEKNQCKTNFVIVSMIYGRGIKGVLSKHVIIPHIVTIVVS